MTDRPSREERDISAPFTFHHSGRSELKIVDWGGEAWLAFKHPDGKWVSECRVEFVNGWMTRTNAARSAIALPAATMGDPLTRAAGRIEGFNEGVAKERERCAAYCESWKLTGVAEALRRGPETHNEMARAPTPPPATTPAREATAIEWRVVDEDGEPLRSGATFPTKQAAEEDAESIRRARSHTGKSWTGIHVEEFTPPPSSRPVESAREGGDQLDAIAGIVLPEYVENEIDGFRAICQRDADKGGGWRARGDAADRLRNAVRRSIHDAERALLPKASDGARAVDGTAMLRVAIERAYDFGRDDERARLPNTKKVGINPMDPPWRTMHVDRVLAEFKRDVDNATPPPEDERVVPVAWMVYDKDGPMRRAADWRQSTADNDCRYFNEVSVDPDHTARRPFRVVPLYATPPPPREECDYECPHYSERAAEFWGWQFWRCDGCGAAFRNIDDPNGPCSDGTKRWRHERIGSLDLPNVCGPSRAGAMEAGDGAEVVKAARALLDASYALGEAVENYIYAADHDTGGTAAESWFENMKEKSSEAKSKFEALGRALSPLRDAPKGGSDHA